MWGGPPACCRRPRRPRTGADQRSAAGREACPTQTAPRPTSRKPTGDFQAHRDTAWRWALLLRIAAAFVLAFPLTAASQSILLIGDEPGAWKSIFGSVGLTVSQATHLPPATLRAHVEAGAFAILEGESEFAAQFGIRPSERRVQTRSLIDTHNPTLPIVWEKALDIPEYSLPPGAQVFARERWTGVPVIAGVKNGSGAILWLARLSRPLDSLALGEDVAQSLGHDIGRLRLQIVCLTALGGLPPWPGRRAPSSAGPQPRDPAATTAP